MRRDAFAAVAIVAAVLAAPFDAHAQAPQGGPEMLVNQVTLGDQGTPSIAFESDGGYVVAWTNIPATITARRFDAAGIPRGPEFTVNVLPTQPNTRPVVAAHPSGGFVVVWQAPDASGSGIFARRFDASGQPTTGEMAVNLTTAGEQHTPRISGGPLGYAVTWGSHPSVVGRLLSATGIPLGAQIQVGTGSESAVAWHGNGLAFTWAEGGNVWLRFFDGAGAPVGAAKVVNGPNPPMSCSPFCFASYSRRFLGVAAAANGGVAVTWDLFGSAATGGVVPNDIYLEQLGSYIRRYDAAGAPVGPETRLNSYTEGSQTTPSAAIAPDGRSFAAWTSAPVTEGCVTCGPTPPPPQDGSGASVYARFFDAGGNDIGGGEFRVTITTLGDQSSPAVAASESSVVVVYQMNTASGRDVYARRYPLSLTPAGLEVDPTDEPQSDGNRVFESGEVVMVAPVWRNPTGAGQFLTSTAMGFGGLPGPTYSIVDASAIFGVIPAGGTRSCREIGDCFFFGVTGARPATHWDTYFTEYAPSPVFFAPRARSLHIGESFVDVPRSSPFYRFVETVFHHAVITRCATTSFCPSSVVTRDAMAFHVVRAASPSLLPPNCVAGSERFLDVPATNAYCPYVEELARRGVVGGCGGGLYCPTQGVTRETMPIYLLLTKEGTGYAPPACTAPIFNDVPATSPFCRWIQELVRRGIAAGCGGGNYCPTATVSREQMAVFLTGTFGLLLYGP